MRLKAKDYSPFGMIMPGRIYRDTSYRFGFNGGSEKDNEIYGVGNAYTTKFRELDDRKGQWITIDPKAKDFPGESPYVAMHDNPIWKNDPNGDCPWCAIGALIGAAADYGVQVSVNYAKGQPDPWTTIDWKEVGIATVAGAASGGVSALYATGGAAVVGGVVLSQSTAQAVVVGTTSVAMQMNQNVNEGKPPLEISPARVALDIATDRIVGKVLDAAAPQIDTKVLEQQADRTARVAANDASSSGRSQNAVTAQNQLNAANNANYAAKTAPSTAASAAGGALTNAAKSAGAPPQQNGNTPASTSNFTLDRTQYQNTAPSDATRVAVAPIKQ